MKRLLLLTLLIIPLLGFTQKTVTITTYPQKVPEGKKWILSNNQNILVEVNRGVLNSGSLCNARFLSNPRILTGIVVGEYGKPREIYGIIFKNLTKATYVNELTFNILPISFVNSDFDLSELRSNNPENVGRSEIKFIQGQKVFVGECLSGIQVIEKDLTPTELATIKEKEKQLELIEQKQKKEEDEKKIKAENELKEKVKNSNEYFFSSQLDNEEDIKVSLTKEALEILNRYLQTFKNKHQEGFNYLKEKYEENLRLAEIRGENPNDYAMLTLTLYFNPETALNKITVKNVLIPKQGLTDLEIPEPFYSELSKNISLSNPGLISIENKDVRVNSSFFLSLTPEESTTELNLKIKKEKTGEVTIKSNSNLLTESSYSTIKSNPKLENLEKGRYTIVLDKIETHMKAFHFNNLNQEEIIKDSFSTIVIKEVR